MRSTLKDGAAAVGVVALQTPTGAQAVKNVEQVAKAVDLVQQKAGSPAPLSTTTAAEASDFFKGVASGFDLWSNISSFWKR